MKEIGIPANRHIDRGTFLEINKALFKKQSTEDFFRAVFS
jgi:hypothetical protein